MKKNPLHSRKAKKPVLHSPAERAVKKAYLTAAMTAAGLVCFSVTAFAAGDPLASVNKLSDFIFAAIKAIGFILLGFGIVQIGLSLKSHDPGQRANGFMTFFGGIVIAFAKDILDLIVG